MWKGVEASADSGCSHFGAPIPDLVIPGEGSVILGLLLIPHPHSTLCSLFQTFLGLSSFG